MWGSKGYAKEVPFVTMATPSLTVSTPQQQSEPVDGESEREREGEREESEGREEREMVSPVRPLTSVGYRRAWYRGTCTCTCS